MQNKVDFLIIGQGLAGSMLAWRLIEAGQKVRVVDEPRPGAASRVAAGLINPVTGKRLVKEPAAESYLSEVQHTYQSLGSQFSKTFYHPKAMLRLFDKPVLKQAWEKRKDDPAYHDFIGESLRPETCAYPSGGFLQKQTAYLKTGFLLDTVKEWLIQHKAYLATAFDYADLELEPELKWKDLRFGKVVFCEGAGVIHNPWFDWLPMQPAKGEILTLQTDEAMPEWIVNNGHWLLPMDDGVFKLGASYEWPDEQGVLSTLTSEKAKTDLLSSLPDLFPGLNQYTVIHHGAGIRPNSLDKRPLIGFHPEHEQLAVLNGFGSKGSMLIPYYSKHFVDVLLNGRMIEADVDVRRVYS